MSSRDISAFIGHVVMAMRFVADFIDGMTLNDFLARTGEMKGLSRQDGDFGDTGDCGDLMLSPMSPLSPKSPSSGTPPVWPIKRRRRPCAVRGRFAIIHPFRPKGRGAGFPARERVDSMKPLIPVGSWLCRTGRNCYAESDGI